MSTSPLKSKILNYLNEHKNHFQNVDKTKFNITSVLGVDRLSEPILSISTIIDIGHFQNRFADHFFMQTNILFTGDIIYWWINNTGEIISFLNALFGSDAACLSSTLCGLEQSPPTAHLICRESRVRPINAENWRQSHTESTC